MFEFFKKLYRARNKLVKMRSMFYNLLVMCREKSSAEIYAILAGYRDTEPIFLTSRHARALLLAISEDDGSINYKYVHAIAPFVYDIWNLSNVDSVLDCYYRDFGKLTECPSTHQKFFSIWSKQNNFNNDAIDVLGKCCICLNEMQLHTIPLFMCLACRQIFHYDCYEKSKETIGSKCPICRAQINAIISKYRWSGLGGDGLVI
mgnify:CR=1 FL=1